MLYVCVWNDEDEFAFLTFIIYMVYIAYHILYKIACCFHFMSTLDVDDTTTPSPTIVPTAGNNATGVIYTATIIPING